MNQNYYKQTLRFQYKNIRILPNKQSKIVHKQSHKILLQALNIITTLLPIKSIIGIYYPLKGEVNMLDLLIMMLDYKFALPAFINKKMVYVYYYKDCPIKKQEYGIYTPIGTNIVIPDVLLVPGIVFDTAGYRIGFGKGYYDQYILQARSVNINNIAIGICFDTQLRNFVPRELYDQKMNYIITNKTLIVT
ncbi:5-formyltetrahydrofolate cyclo-ligase [Orientia chuto str. Dubai]|uniref:5-formyltetrahydrofolate cyclo-ligase n=1 Tax=Orientia chuto str. Dubai TaxID=1359168 RepID=A0A0F3MG57_9RICK|nr:5-formyltetrahydrofolate cyclo-ligase [Candidatus Orientia mediorientalis]KJV54730.1 5-formyltetrahydrofolate cyclo-ligase [Orientia chuto str. Dubai]